MTPEHPTVHHLVDNLFRTESGRMVAVLTRIFGADNIELAEDVVQDSLVEAMNSWTYNGIPDNPSAWLFRVAKNKALNVVNREKYKQQYSSDVAHLLQSEWTADAAMEHLFSEEEILDDQLRMIFTCCDPAISADSQIALALKTLCGFSIPEIARAFLTIEENINKRLVRARQKIRDQKSTFEVPAGPDLDKRTNTVLETIYLLFNEGYSASGGADLVRYELCEEAIRLAAIIASHPAIAEKTNVYGLLALMYLNASRFKARTDPNGNLLTMAEQDRGLWDPRLQRIGLGYLQQATHSASVGTYAILAAISANYCIAPDYRSTDWRAILSLYDTLIQLDNSPLVQLNRAIPLAQVNGPVEALAVLEQIKDELSIRSYHLFYSTQAEFYIQLGRNEEAIRSLDRAIELARLDAERVLLQKKKMLLSN